MKSRLSHEGRPELATRAIEEYKLALNADPSSPQLNLALANLYFRSGHAREAENTVRGLLKSAPEDIEAHKLLGRIYLRTLSEGQNAPVHLLAQRQRAEPGDHGIREDCRVAAEGR
jgi:Tfp pilus assembly protein PilF